MTSTRLRWAACAALLTCALLLTISLLRNNDSTSTAAPPPLASSAPLAPSTLPTATQLTPSDPSGSVVTRPSPSAASADPSAVRPTRPDATLGLTVGAAEALTRFYFEQAENHLKLTGDGSVVREMASPVCRPCLGEITIFRSINGRNKRLTGDYLWKNIDVRGVRSTSANSTVVAVDLTRGRHAAILKPGAKPTRYPGGPAELNITLIAENGNWLVFDKAIR